MQTETLITPCELKTQSLNDLTFKDVMQILVCSQNASREDIGLPKDDTVDVSFRYDPKAENIMINLPLEVPKELADKWTALLASER